MCNFLIVKPLIHNLNYKAPFNSSESECLTFKYSYSCTEFETLALQFFHFLITKSCSVTAQFRFSCSLNALNSVASLWTGNFIQFLFLCINHIKYPISIETYHLGKNNNGRKKKCSGSNSKNQRIFFQENTSIQQSLLVMTSMTHVILRHKRVTMTSRNRIERQKEIVGVNCFYRI